MALPPLPSLRQSALPIPSFPPVIRQDAPVPIANELTAPTVSAVAASTLTRRDVPVWHVLPVTVPVVPVPLAAKRHCLRKRDMPRNVPVPLAAAAVHTVLDAPALPAAVLTVWDARVRDAPPLTVPAAAVSPAAAINKLFFESMEKLNDFREKTNNDGRSLVGLI